MSWHLWMISQTEFPRSAKRGASPAGCAPSHSFDSGISFSFYFPAMKYVLDSAVLLSDIATVHWHSFVAVATFLQKG
jgi:hypothetical protein